MKTTRAGIDLIKKFEGFSPVAYRCPAGYPTIGYGHAIGKEEKFGRITVKEAEELLMRDLSYFEGQVSRMLQVQVNPHQFSALVSFAYNLGAHRLKQSTLLRLLNAEDYAGAAKQFGRWIYARDDGKNVRLEGLVRRRKAEMEMFLTGSTTQA